MRSETGLNRWDTDLNSVPTPNLNVLAVDTASSIMLGNDAAPSVTLGNDAASSVMLRNDAVPMDSTEQGRENQLVNLSREDATDATRSMTLGAGVDQLWKRVMVAPFVPGVSERLQSIAKKYGLSTWHAFPGKVSDLFMLH